MVKYHFCGGIEFSYRTLIFQLIRNWIWDLRFSWHCAWLLGLAGCDTMCWDEQVLSVWGKLLSLPSGELDGLIKFIQMLIPICPTTWCHIQYICFERM